jgi:hypothetical protein
MIRHAKQNYLNDQTTKLSTDPTDKNWWKLTKSVKLKNPIGYFENH